ncbi:MAG: large subunit ribosomal protein L32 [Myxococcota bacterium]|jgi:large subunit ribosomal protein L32
MAVPKRKTSKSKRNMRRGSNGTYSLTLPNITVDATTGEYKLAHHISSDGHYNGRKVIDVNKKNSETEEEAKDEA